MEQEEVGHETHVNNSPLVCGGRFIWTRPIGLKVLTVLRNPQRTRRPMGWKQREA